MLTNKNTVKGLAEWQKKIGKIPKKALKDIAERTEKRGKGMRWQAKQLVPRDTGNLNSSIEIDVKNTRKSTSITVSTKETYAAAVEYGTSKHSAQPYMIPAFNKYSKKYVDEDLRIALKKAVRSK